MAKQYRLLKKIKKKSKQISNYFYEKEVEGFDREMEAVHKFQERIQIFGIKEKQRTNEILFVKVEKSE